MIWADYLLRVSRSFDLFGGEEIETSYGSKVRSSSEEEFFKSCGYKRQYGLRLENGSSDYRGPDARGALASHTGLTQGLAVLVGAVDRDGRPQTSHPRILSRSQDPNLFPRRRGCGSRLDHRCRAAPKALRAETFLYGDPCEDSKPKKKNQVEAAGRTREFRKTWERSQKECPRVREMRKCSAGELRLMEDLVWSCRYDWTIAVERETNPFPTQPASSVIDVRCPCCHNLTE